MLQDEHPQCLSVHFVTSCIDFDEKRHMCVCVGGGQENSRKNSGIVFFKPSRNTDGVYLYCRDV